MAKLTRDKYLLEDEYKRLIYQAKVRNHVNAKRDYALLVVGGGAGLRVKEIVSLREADLFLSNKPPFIRVTTAKKKADIYQEDLPVPSSVAKALRRHVADLRRSGDLNPWDRIFPITTRQAERVFKRYAKLAGLNPKYSIHSLRHFRGLHVYEKTKDIQLVRDALRHASITSSQVYVHLVDVKRIAAIDVEDQDGEEEGVRGQRTEAEGLPAGVVRERSGGVSWSESLRGREVGDVLVQNRGTR